MSLGAALERAASHLSAQAETIRPANGDPMRLLASLEVEGVAALLGWLLANELEAAEELLDAWGETSEGIEGILRTDSDSLPREGRKALRRARHRLRSRGVPVEEPSAPPVVAKLPPVEDALRAAFVTAVDPVGARIAYLVLPHPAGGARLFEVVLDEVRGIVDCHVYNTGRRDARRFLREVAERERYAALPVSLDALRALIARIAAHHPSNRPLPTSFGEWRSELATAPEGAQTPGESAREALGPVDPARHQARAVDLVREQELGPWPPSEAVLRDGAQSLETACAGRIVVSGAHKQERLERALGELANSVFDAAFARCSAERFEETAYVFHARGREDDARACLAAARLFREEKPEANPVARALLEVLFAPALKTLGEEDEASLLVKP